MSGAGNLLIEARDVSKRYGSLLAVEPMTMAIPLDRPAITAVVGESGSGKTTLARILLGLITPSGGEMRYRGEPMQGLTSEQRRDFRRDVQAIFQDPYEVYNPFYRVDHVLTTPVRNFKLASSKAAGRALIEDSLRAVGLRPEEILGRYPHQLSGGQRQRIMVARAVLMRPKLIVADEPVSMVDASLRATILTSLQKLRDERGISIIYITHDLATAYQVSDNIVVMYHGAVVEAGDVEQVVKAPQHPYTQLLIASIPQVSTDRSWLAADAPVRAQSGHAGNGCNFAPRCPRAVDACLPTPPPLRRTGVRRLVACVHYPALADLPAAGLGEILADTEA